MALVALVALAACRSGVQVWVATGDRQRLLRREADVSFGDDAPDTRPVIAVHADRVGRHVRVALTGIVGGGGLT